MPDEGFVLDNLNLNGAGLVVESGDFTPPAKRLEWSNGADADGALLVRDPLVENRVIKLTMRVLPTATMQLAAARVLEISKKLEECEQNPGGLPLVWTPADGTVAALTFYVLTGSVTELPISQVGDSGYFVKAPMLAVELTCKPFGYGTEVVVTATTSTEPVLTLTVPSVPGDVPAEGRLIVTDNATQQRRTVEWGLEQRHYNAATSLVIDSDTLVTTGYGGTLQTRTGAYDANAVGTNVLRVTLSPTNTAIAGVAALSHVGTFRVKARVYASSALTYVRLAWRDGDGVLNTNAYVSAPVINAFSEIDLGVIDVTPATLGTQAWSGQIEGYGPSGAVLDVDYLSLLPVAEGYGRATGKVRLNAPGILVASDAFAAGTGGAALNGRTADAGGAWATSGAATDFLYDTGRAAYTRATTADASRRFATLGATNYSTVYVSGSLQFTAYNAAVDTVSSGLLFRFVDANNWAAVLVQTRAPLFAGSSSVGNFVTLLVCIAGVETPLHSAGFTVPPANTFMEMQVQAEASGAVSANIHGVTVSGSSTALATGGALATGKVGFVDRQTGGAGASTRSFDTIVVISSVGTQPPAIHPGRNMEFRADGSALRQDAAGVSYGQTTTYRGSRFLVPAAGDKNRTTRVAVVAARNDTEVAAYEPIGDSLTAQVRYIPRFLVVRA